MLLTVFEPYFFLQALGMAIITSIAQGLLLWILYKATVLYSHKLTAHYRYVYTLLLFALLAVGFFTGIMHYYFQLAYNSSPGGSLFTFKFSTALPNFFCLVSLFYIPIAVVNLLRFVFDIKALTSINHLPLMRVPVHLRLFTQQTAYCFGITKEVRIRLCEKISVPSVIGFLKPAIVLPVAAINHLSPEQTEAIILHELAHIKRNDFIINLILHFAERLLFFNPFARLLYNEIDIERENCCDDWVLHHQYNRQNYAAALLLLEQNRQEHEALLAPAATNGKKKLLCRIQRLMQIEISSKKTVPQKLQLLLLVLLTVVSFFQIPALPVKLNKPLTVNNTIKTQPAFSLAGVNNNRTPAAPNKVATVSNKVDLNGGEKKIKAASVPFKKRVPEIAGLNQQSIALIHEDLLTATPEYTPDAIAHNNLPAPKEAIVAIEEERSGEKNKSSYLVELKNVNGNIQAKPLLLVKKKTGAKTIQSGKPVIKSVKKRVTA